MTQDIFIQIYESLDTFNKQSTLKTWIYRITINKCLDFIKHKNCQKRFYIFGKKTKSEINKSISSEFNSDKSTIEKDFNPFFNVLTKHQSVENNDLKKITVTVFRNIFKSIIVC